MVMALKIVGLFQSLSRGVIIFLICPIRDLLESLGNNAEA